MVFKISLQTLPEIREVYEIERKTIWRCADRHNILILITEGACQINMDDKNIMLKKGDYILIPPGKKYVRRPVNDSYCKFLYVHFSIRSSFSILSNKDAENELKETFEKNALISYQRRLSVLPDDIYVMQYGKTGDDFEYLAELLRKIPPSRHMATYTSPLLISLYFAEFLSTVSIDISQGISGEGTTSEIPPTLRKAITFIQQNYNKKISTDQLSEYCHISPQHMIRLFKQHLGTTPLQYINKNKTSNAIDLLRNSELSVAEIAYSLGYDNPSYFSRMFTKEEGISPSELRTKILTYKDGKGVLIEN